MARPAKCVRTVSLWPFNGQGMGAEYSIRARLVPTLLPARRHGHPPRIGASHRNALSCHAGALQATDRKWPNLFDLMPK